MKILEAVALKIQENFGASLKTVFRADGPHLLVSHVEEAGEMMSAQKEKESNEEMMSPEISTAPCTIDKTAAKRYEEEDNVSLILTPPGRRDCCMIITLRLFKFTYKHIKLSV